MSHRIGKPGKLEDDGINTSYVKLVIIYYLTPNMKISWIVVVESIK